MEKLINDLIERTRENLNQAQNFKEMPEEELQWRALENSWSVLECIAHLNRYGNFYLPEIKRRIKAAKPAAPGQKFKAGLLGNYFAQSMLPKAKLNTMKTFKSMNPLHSTLGKNTIDEFILQQKQMLDILQSCRKVDLNKVKTSISISRLIKLRLGDTLRVVVYHNQRHLVQARKVLKQYEVAHPHSSKMTSFIA